MRISAYLGNLRRPSNPYADSASLEFQFRVKRFSRIRSMIDCVLEEQDHCEIVDLGGTEQYWAIAGDYLESQKNRVFVTLVNTEAQIMSRPEQFCAVRESACDPGLFEKKRFDLAHSNSLIEHLGSRENMRSFGLNMRRLAPRYYCQTPNYWFPYEPHFRTLGFQFLPRTVRVALLQRFPLGFFDRIDDPEEAEDIVRHHDLISRRQLAIFLPDAEITFETVLGLRKSIIATRGAPSPLQR